jgi:hypothetical protein
VSALARGTNRGAVQVRPWSRERHTATSATEAPGWRTTNAAAARCRDRWATTVGRPSPLVSGRTRISITPVPSSTGWPQVSPRSVEETTLIGALNSGRGSSGGSGGHTP